VYNFILAINLTIIAILHFKRNCILPGKRKSRRVRVVAQCSQFRERSR